MANPFHSGGPVTGDHFADRETELRFLVRRMRDGQNVFLLSPRRYGKTSLLLRAAEEVRRARGRVAMANLFYCESRREVAEQITQAVVERGLGWLQGSAAQVRERFHHLPWVTPQLEHQGWKYSIAVGAPGHSFVDEIRRPVELLAQSARAGQPVCLVLDEFQQIEEVDAALAGIFKAMTDELRGVSLVFAGSRRHVMQRLFVERGAPLQNVADVLGLDVIEQAEMVPFLLSRSQAGGRRMTEAAGALVYRLMLGVPDFVQQLAASAYDLDVDPIDEPAVRGALVVLLQGQGVVLAQRWEDLAPVQRRILRALAAEPTRELFSVSFARRTEAALSSLQRAVRGKRGLEERELIMFDGRVGWRLTDPIFARWIVYGLPLQLGESVDPNLIE